MIDFIKLFFASIHDLPPMLRHGFVVLFFTTAILFSVSFKRWLEVRKTHKDADFWAQSPVGPSVAQVLMWVVWATCSLVSAYDKAPVTAATPGRAIPAPSVGIAGTGLASAAIGLASAPVVPGVVPRPAHRASPAASGVAQKFATGAAAAAAADAAPAPSSVTHPVKSASAKPANATTAHTTTHFAHSVKRATGSGSASLGIPAGTDAPADVAPAEPGVTVVNADAKASVAAAGLRSLVAESTATATSDPAAAPAHQAHKHSALLGLPAGLAAAAHGH